VGGADCSTQFCVCVRERELVASEVLLDSSPGVSWGSIAGVLLVGSAFLLSSLQLYLFSCCKNVSLYHAQPLTSHACYDGTGKTDPNQTEVGYTEL
jgi:hypothetical protein